MARSENPRFLTKSLQKSSKTPSGTGLIFEYETPKQGELATEQFFFGEKNGSTPNYFVQKLGDTP